MLKISHIKINGFRRLKDIDLQLRPLSVLIGANGVGKTSLLEVFSLLALSSSQKMEETISSLGGFSSILTKDGTNDISLAIDFHVPRHNPLNYFLQLSQKASGYSIEAEVLSQKRHEGTPPFKHIDSVRGNIRYFKTEKGKLIRPEWEHNPLETSLSQVPKMFSQPEMLRKTLSTTTHYHALDVSPRAAVRLPQAMKPASLPGKNGEDLIPYLYYLRETDRDRFEVITDTLAVAFPSFEELNFPPVASGLLSMTWKDKNFDKPFYTHELSEGSLRFLWLTALLYSPALSAITMIDEPEVSLHPELLSIMAEVMRGASTRTQIIVATHSDRLVRFLNQDEIVVMDADENGFTTARWANDLDLEKWLEDYTLDQVWSMGRMGGRS